MGFPKQNVKGNLLIKWICQKQGISYIKWFEGGSGDLRFGVLSTKIRDFLNKIQREFVKKMNMSKVKDFLNKIYTV